VALQAESNSRTGRGDRPRRRSERRKRAAVLLVLAVSLALVASAALQALGFNLGSPSARGASSIELTVVRTGPSAASVLGYASPGDQAIDILVDGNVVRSGRTMWTSEYWFLNVPVADGSTVQTRIGSQTSDVVPVPSHVPQPVGPSGFIYAQGTNLMRDGSPITLFGPDEGAAFTWALITWGENQPQHAGKNQLFPSGPDTQIPGISTPDDLWREYFRYFLHYKQNGDPDNPPANLLRIWIVDLNWGTMAYDVLENQPDVFYELFDRMLYWAGRADVYVVPIIGQNIVFGADNAYFDRSSSKYARHLAFARTVMEHYQNSPQIAMWDLWNEADVWDDAYWGSVGGIDGYRSWLTGLVADLRPSDTNHLITVGSAQWPLMPGLATDFGWRRHYAYNLIPGIDVAHEHSYFEDEDQYLVDWRVDWGAALRKPFYMGEYGYSGATVHPLGYGYWPWFTREWIASGVGPLSPMVFVDNSKGPYADYPYTGSLPDYPPEGPPTNQPPVASFTWSPANPNVNESITFDGSASADPDGSIVSYAWTFGDGTSGSGAVVQKAYAQAGTHTVRLTVTDNQSATGTSARTITVAGSGPPPNVPPTAAFTYAPASPNAGIPVTFNASQSSDPDGTIVSYQWWFEDGGSTAMGEQVTHTFANPGAFDVWLTVTDDRGAASSVMHTVTVSPGAPAPNEPPVASFSFSPQSPVAGQPVAFDASASTDERGITQYAWDFGNGDTAQGQRPSYAYPSPGSFTVTLTVSDGDGAQDIASATVAVRSDTVNSPGAPRVASVSLAPTGTELDIVFSEGMDRPSVEQAVSVGPSTPYRTEWPSGAHLRLVFLSPLTPGGAYVVVVRSSAKDLIGTSLEDDFSFGFTAPLSQPQTAAASWDVLLLVVVILIGWSALSALAIRYRMRLNTLFRMNTEMMLRIEELEPPTSAGVGASPRGFRPATVRSPPHA